MKGGKILTAVEGRKIAEAGGKVWMELEEYDPDDPSYEGPATFSHANYGYYITADNDIVETDIDFDDHEDSTPLDFEEDTCHFTLRELLGS